MTDKQVLRFLNELWGDLRDPDFIWQVAALLLCLGLAAAGARWWRQRSAHRAGRLHGAGSRLAFPFLALVLVGVALPVLKPFVHVNLLKLAFPLLGSLALVRCIVYVLRSAFPAAGWLSAWERGLALIIWGWLALEITDLAPYVIDTLQQVAFTVGKQRVDLWMLLHGAVTVFLTLVLALWLSGALEARLIGMAELDSSLRIVAVRVVKAVLTLLAILLSLSLVGIDMTALSVFTGALGVGLGFGLQKIASNYVSGFIILLDRSIRLGNVIRVDANAAGIVTQITTRYTVIRNPAGTEFIVPNETLVGTIVQNQSFSDSRVRVTVNVGVAYGTDLDVAMALMETAAAAQPRVLADPAPKVFLTQFGDSALNLELGFWIGDPHEGTGAVCSAINLAIWQAFKAQGIEIPFPQREVRVMGQVA